MIPIPKRSADKRTFCGPFALAVINGMTCDEAQDAIQKSLRRKRQVKGMWNSEVERVSRGQFFRHALRFKRMPRGITLMNLADYLNPNRLYMVNVTGHYIVVNTEDWTACCTRAARMDAASRASR